MKFFEKLQRQAEREIDLRDGKEPAPEPKKKLGPDTPRAELHIAAREGELARSFLQSHFWIDLIEPMFEKYLEDCASDGLFNLARGDGMEKTAFRSAFFGGRRKLLAQIGEDIQDFIKRGNNAQIQLKEKAQ